MKYKTFIWDFDGTLFDTYPICAQVFSAELKKLGIDCGEETVSALARVSLGKLYDFLFEEYRLGSDFVARCGAICRDAEDRNAKPFDGARDFLAEVTAAGGRNCLYTHRGKSALSMLDNAGMLKYICDYVISDDGFAYKPCPDAVNYLIRRNGSNAIIIGDREIDVLSGKNAGTGACLFRPLEIGSTCADFVCLSFAELKATLM